MPARQPPVYQLTISLVGARPPIWRRVLMDYPSTFLDLHRTIQLAMGWQTSHLHLFQLSNGVLIGDPAEDGDGMMDYANEAMVPLHSVLTEERAARSGTNTILATAGSTRSSWRRCFRWTALDTCPDALGLSGNARQRTWAAFRATSSSWRSWPIHRTRTTTTSGNGQAPTVLIRNLSTSNRSTTTLPTRTNCLRKAHCCQTPAKATSAGLSPNQVHELLQSPLDCPQSSTVASTSHQHHRPSSRHRLSGCCRHYSKTCKTKACA